MSMEPETSTVPGSLVAGEKFGTVARIGGLFDADRDRGSAAAGLHVEVQGCSEEERFLVLSAGGVP